MNHPSTKTYLVGPFCGDINCRVLETAPILQNTRFWSTINPHSFEKYKYQGKTKASGP